MKNQKRIDQLKLEMQIAVDEFNKIQEKIKDLVVGRDALKMKAYGCEERIKELEKLNDEVEEEIVQTDS